MKTLPQVRATGEQLPLISQNRSGVEIICGAAGSGKTSTALLRLRSLSLMFAARNARRNDAEPVSVLVLAFNRTLAGYVRNLAEHQIAPNERVSLEIETFGRWAMQAFEFPDVDTGRAKAELRRLARAMNVLTPDYIIKEVDYLIGRFEPEALEQYVTTERTGRGAMPRVTAALRRRILDEVVYPYNEFLRENGILDWNSLAVMMARREDPPKYDIIIIDESQDFSANELRAIRHHLADEHSVTFVIDTIQRIYARGFTWIEAGFDVRPERVHTLRSNHRNTIQTATFAAGILNGMRVEGDGALPNLTAAMGNGPLPQVLRGRYSDQIDWAVDYIRENVDLENESVAFLKPRAGNWFSLTRSRLQQAGIAYAELTREADWPEGVANTALCTFHSAKGLEFDHVFILGFNDENTPYAEEELDDQVFVLRRLLAVAVARARKAVVIGYKPGAESRLVAYFANGTYDQVTL